MLQTPSENKLLQTNDREKLIDALLQSPLGKQLQQSMGNSADAIRAHAAKVLADAIERHNVRMSRLQLAATDLIEKRDALKKAFETADREAQGFIDRVTSERQDFSSLRQEIDAVSTASAARLEAQGLTSVAAFDAKFRTR